MIILDNANVIKKEVFLFNNNNNNEKIALFIDNF